MHVRPLAGIALTLTLLAAAAGSTRADLATALAPPPRVVAVVPSASGPPTRASARAARSAEVWAAAGAAGAAGATVSITSFVAPVSDPWGIVTGPDGALWFTNNDNHTIGRITTRGVISVFKDARISGPMGIAAGEWSLGSSR